MLPSEKAELLVRRVGYALLVLIALYIIVWLFGYISRIFKQTVQQRDMPEDARAPLVQVG